MKLNLCNLKNYIVAVTNVRGTDDAHVFVKALEHSESDTSNNLISGFEAVYFSFNLCELKNKM